jgi:diguanylate cyclase (GGDEF)-like protein
VKRTSVHAPIILGFGAMLLILTAVVLANVYQTHVFSEHIRAIVQERNKKSELAALMNELHRARYRSLIHASVLTDPFARDDEIRYFRDMAREFIEARDEFMSLPLDESEISTWESIRVEVRKVEAEAESIIDHLEDDDLDTAKRMISTRLASMQEKMMAGWSQMLYVQSEKNKQALLDSARMDRDLRQLSIVLGGVAVLIGFSVAMFAVRTSRRLEEALVNEKEQAQTTLESISDAVIRVNPQGDICYLNPPAEFLLDMQLQPGDCKPVDALQLIERESRKPLLDGVLTDLRRNLKVVLPENTCLVTKEGMEYDIQGSASPLRLGPRGASGAVIILRDVTEARSSLRRQYGYADFDPVTGLSDPRAIEDRLASALHGKRSADQPMGFLLVRLGNLESIRASAGNSAAESILQQIGQILRLRVRDRDLICRLGPDSLGMLLAVCPEAKVAEIADDVRQSLALYHFDAGSERLSVDALIGKVLIPPFSGTLEECMRAAGASS